MSSTAEFAARMAADLAAAAARHLLTEWRNANAYFFKSSMLPPSIEVIDSKSLLGRFRVEERSIEISRDLVLKQPWRKVVEVLKHEMAHQYVFEVLKVFDETAHGQAFRQVCDRMGVDPSACGLPELHADTSSDEESKIIERISRLMALAESPNEHEAQAAMNAAQRLMLKYNLDHSATHKKTRPNYGFQHVGVPTGRVQESDRILADILIRFFFVEAVWVPVYRPLLLKTGTVLEICGSHANLEMASYVHNFLSDTAERLWKEHKRRSRIAGDRDRRSFITGVMLGFRDKLLAQDKIHQEQGLVWLKDAHLEDYFHRRYPRLRTVSYRGGSITDALAQGRQAGKSIDLHRPMDQRGGGGPRLLGSGDRSGIA